MYGEDELLMLSALQHLLFCPRQCGLIHIEQQWVENRFTAEGRVMHDRVHSDGRASRGNIRTVFGVPLRSLMLGVVGKADVVEFHLTGADQVKILDAELAKKHGNGKGEYWLPFPVEYKRGKPKKDNCDRVQLCAQAICLEEMTGMEILKGALFYGKNRRRQAVDFDQGLRNDTKETAEALHDLFASGKTPLPEYSKKCDSCSFVDLCLPKTFSGKGAVGKYYKTVLDI
ncbi:MAG: CRISPR-associated protein Cas4 [Thermodesulfobacteriota bacterium]|nr:CRISPR-associated protein Cas4 [Thermodesulfobacteriota bacterium]